MPPVLAAIPAVAGVVATKLGASALVASLVTIGTSIGASLLAPKPKLADPSKENIDRLRASIDPRTPRKTIIGWTAMGCDIR